MTVTLTPEAWPSRVRSGPAPRQSVIDRVRPAWIIAARTPGTGWGRPFPLPVVYQRGARLGPAARVAA